MYQSKTLLLERLATVAQQQARTTLCIIDANETVSEEDSEW